MKEAWILVSCANTKNIVQLKKISYKNGDKCHVTFLWVSLKESLTHWGPVTHICIAKLTIFGSDTGLSPGWQEAMIWKNAGILLIGPLGTNFSEISIKIHTFSLKKMHLKMSSVKWRQFCHCLNVLTVQDLTLSKFCFRIIWCLEFSLRYFYLVKS